MVFLSTCDGVDFHFALLTEFELQPETNQKSKFLNCTVFRLHGNMKQEDRAKAFQGFKTEKSALLLSTDVAARGLDFPRVRCIVQYDSPGEASEYVHRYSFLSVILFYKSCNRGGLIRLTEELLHYNFARDS